MCCGMAWYDVAYGLVKFSGYDKVFQSMVR